MYSIRKYRVSPQTLSSYFFINYRSMRLLYAFVVLLSGLTLKAQVTFDTKSTDQCDFKKGEFYLLFLDVHNKRESYILNFILDDITDLKISDSYEELVASLIDKGSVIHYFPNGASYPDKIMACAMIQDFLKVSSKLDSLTFDETEYASFRRNVRLSGKKSHLRGYVQRFQGELWIGDSIEIKEITGGDYYPISIEEYQEKEVLFFKEIFKIVGLSQKDKSLIDKLSIK